MTDEKRPEFVLDKTGKELVEQHVPYLENLETPDQLVVEALKKLFVAQGLIHMAHVKNNESRQFSPQALTVLRDHQRSARTNIFNAEQDLTEYQAASARLKRTDGGTEQPGVPAPVRSPFFKRTES